MARKKPFLHSKSKYNLILKETKKKIIFYCMKFS